MRDPGNYVESLPVLAFGRGCLYMVCENCPVSLICGTEFSRISVLIYIYESSLCR